MKTIKKLKKISPNHFIAVKINDALIKENVAQFQKRVVQKNPLLNNTIIDLRKLHITLAVTYLENEEQTVELQKKLQDWSEKNMKAHFTKPLNLMFKGVGTFGKTVAFAKINEGENYQRLCLLSSAMNDLLHDSGFYREDRKTFTPHLTLLKLSKDVRIFKKMKEVSGDIANLNECDDDFGSQEVKGIQLLSMTAKNEDDGCYKCMWQVSTKEEPEVGN